MHLPSDKVLELKTENNTEQPINWIHRYCVGGWRGPWSVWVDDYWSMSTINTQSLWISVVVFLFFFNVVLIWLRLLLDDFKSKYWFPRLYYYIHPHRLKADLDPTVLLAKRWWESGTRQRKVTLGDIMFRYLSWNNDWKLWSHTFLLLPFAIWSGLLWSLSLNLSQIAINSSLLQF